MCLCLPPLENDQWEKYGFAILNIDFFKCKKNHVPFSRNFTFYISDHFINFKIYHSMMIFTIYVKGSLCLYLLDTK